MYSKCFPLYKYTRDLDSQTNTPSPSLPFLWYSYREHFPSYLTHPTPLFLSSLSHPLPPLILPKITRLQIPRHARQSDLQPVQLGTHLDLAAQPARFGQPEGEIEHVVFVVVGLGHGVVDAGVCDYDVAGAAGAGAAACAFHF